MNEVKIGDRIKDNDPRVPHRILVVEKFAGMKVLCRSAGGRSVGINIERIYTDGKPRKSGFSVVRK